MLPSSLQISIVTHRPDAKLLERCLRKLALAIGAAREDGAMRTVHLALIDNSEDRDDRRQRDQARQDALRGFRRACDLPARPRQIGYGAAHNLVLHGTGSDYHLVLNPDVELAPDALANAVRWLDAHEDVGALAPLARDARRHSANTCASAIRPFSICSCADSRRRFCAACFAGGSTRYEMRDLMDVEPPRDVIGIRRFPGAFMLVKRVRHRQHRRLRSRSSSSISRTSTGACA